MIATVQPDLDVSREHAVLMRQYARVQERCSHLLHRQQDEIEALSAANVRLRGAVVVRETQLAWLREDQHASNALVPALQERKVMSRRIDELLARVQGLLRERERPLMATALQCTAVEWQDPGSAGQLEASVAAADLVICQTGCLSHGDYWRVQDHCRRTGKTCVMVEQPDLRIVTVQRRPRPPNDSLRVPTMAF